VADIDRPLPNPEKEPAMDTTHAPSLLQTPAPSDRGPHRSDYAAPLEASRRIRWDIDRDVFRGRELDFTTKFLPEGLTRVGALTFLGAADRRLLSQIQGRTYANIFGLVERFINAKVLELSRTHWFGDQTALEMLVRFSDEELKHQTMFRRLEEMIGRGMPHGYRAAAQPDEVAAVVLGKSSWSVLALTCHIELFTQAHYKQSIAPDPELSPLYKDVFLFHWKEESQHAIVDELEWVRADAHLGPAARDAAVDDFIALVGAVDGLLQAQAAADVDYFLQIASGGFTTDEIRRLRAGVLGAYRWQYIFSGAEHPHFRGLLGRLVTPEQGARIGRALEALRA
jgi:hypothetical protein